MKIDVTYETITPESAAGGEAEDAGFRETGRDYGFRELYRIVADCEPSQSFLDDADAGSHVWFTEIDSEPDYRTGAETRLSYHFADSPRAVKHWRKLVRLVLARRRLSWSRYR